MRTVTSSRPKYSWPIINLFKQLTSSTNVFSNVQIYQELVPKTLKPSNCQASVIQRLENLIKLFLLFDRLYKLMLVIMCVQWDQDPFSQREDRQMRLYKHLKKPIKHLPTLLLYGIILELECLKKISQSLLIAVLKEHSFQMPFVGIFILISLYYS